MQNGGEEKRQGSENLMQNGPGEEKRQCVTPGGPGCKDYCPECPVPGEEKRQGSENLMQNGPGGEEERGCGTWWEPCSRQGNENLMQNGGEEKRQDYPANDMMQHAFEEKRQGNENLMQNGPGGEEKRRGNMFMNPNWINDCFNWGNGGGCVQSVGGMMDC